MRIAIAAGLLAFAAPLAAAEPKLPELNLSYSVEWRGFGLGALAITLKPDGGADCYRYESTTNPVGLVRMFFGTPHEMSRFCISGGRLVSRHFEYYKSKNDDQNFTLDFDGGKVRDDRGKVREVPPNAYDRFALQQAVRLWVLAHLNGQDKSNSVDLAMVDQTDIKTYRFAITGRDAIDIPAGHFDTFVAERIDNPNRTSKYWLAPSRDFMPVKVEQGRNGRVDLRMELRKS